MKKILTFLLVLILLIVMPFSIACNETPDNNGDPPSTEEGNPGNEDGGETPGGDNGGETPGGDNNEGENSGGGNTGGDNTEGENPGDNSGSTDPKPPMTGEGEIPDDDRGTIIK
ncbi:MAG: hypothetical protein IJW26_05450 [Clostridia bacterium]|nr:hypothetical protein [Clostridia bacterium]